MSKQPKETTTTTKSEPWAEAKPYYNGLYKTAQDALEATNKNPYTGNLTALPTTPQVNAVDRLSKVNLDGNVAGIQQGITALGGLAGKIADVPQYQANPNDSNAIRANAGKTTAFADDLASGRWLNPETNPYLKTNVQTALDQASDSWNRSINPSLQDAAIRSGAYGGSRNGIATGLAASEVGKTQQQTAAQMYGANYENERNRMMQVPAIYASGSGQTAQASGVDQSNYQTQLAGVQAQQNAAQIAAGLYSTQAQLAQQNNNMTLQDIQAEAAAGQQVQAWQQALNDDEYLRYQIQQQAPWAGLAEMSSILNGGGFQTTSATAPNPNYRSTGQQILGGLSTGVSILGMPWTGGASLGATLFK